MPPLVPRLYQDIFSSFCWHPSRVTFLYFVICYLCSSFTHPAQWGIVLSYVHDFSLTVSSPSYHTNSRFLQAAFGRIRAIAHSRKVDFSVPKTELIQWRTRLQRDPPGALRPPCGSSGQPNIPHLQETQLAGLLVCSEPCLLRPFFPATGIISS